MAGVVAGVSAASTSNNAALTTGTFSTTAGDLLVAFAVASGQATGGTFTDSQNLGWTNITTALKNASADILVMAVSNSFAGTSATATVTFTPAGGPTATGVAISVLRVTGMTRKGIDAIRNVTGAGVDQFGSQANQAASGTPTPTVPNSVLTTNAMVGAVANGTNPATMTAPASWTEAHDVGYNTPATGLETAFRSGGATGTSFAWGSTSGTAFSSIVAELDASVPQDEESYNPLWNTMNEWRTSLYVVQGAGVNDSAAATIASPAPSDATTTIIVAPKSGKYTKTPEARTDESISPVSVFEDEALPLSIYTPTRVWTLGTISWEDDFVPLSGNNYFETMSGGVICGGSATATWAATATGSGPITVSGTASKIWNATASGSGGIVCGGSSTISHAVNITSSGGIVISGTNQPTWSINISSTGKVTIGGSATAIWNALGSVSGGIIIGGSATTSASFLSSMSGGINIRGSNTPVWAILITGSGPVVIGGTAGVSQSGHINEAFSGGLVMGGSGTVIQSLVTQSAGGVIMSGANAPTWNIAVTPAGGINMSGTATKIWNATASGTGGLLMGGAAIPVWATSYVVSGGVIVGQTFQTIYSALITTLGGLVLSGTASNNMSYSVLMDKGLVMSGAISTAWATSFDPSGTITLDGSALIELVTAEALVSGIFSDPWFMVAYYTLFD